MPESRDPHCPGPARALVLASASPRRRELLTNLGLDFAVDPSTTPEILPPGLDIAAAVSHVATLKALEVASRHPDAHIIAADTLVALDDAVLGKPRDADDARDMLRRLSGVCHHVVTGLVLLDAASKALQTRVVNTQVYFRHLSDSEIDAYVATGEPLDKAGAYGIQGLASVFVDRIDGDYSNVVGLPIAALNDLLRHAGCCILCRRQNARGGD